MSTSRLTRSARAARVDGRCRPMHCVALAVGVTVLASVVAGCGSNGVDTQPGPTADSAPTVSTSNATSSAPTPRQAAGAAAISQVASYEHTLDVLARDPHGSLDRLYKVSTQPDVTDEIAFLNLFRSRGDRQTGASQVTASRVDAIDLPTVVGGRTATARVTICLDVAHVNAVDRSGKSIVAKSRKPYYLTRLLLINARYPDRRGWLIKRVSATEERSCSV